MFGKHLGYRVEDQKVNIEFEQQTGVIEIIDDGIINVFAGLQTKERVSYAIEGAKVKKIDFEVSQTIDCVSIKTRQVEILVYDDFKVDFKDINGELLCEDYRGERAYEESVSHASLILASQEGHEISLIDKRHKIEIIKTMFGDEKFYGLGDKTGHLNKRDYAYEMWNSNIPAPHMESFKSLYKSIPFFITLREKSVFGIFYDNHFKTYFDMGKENNNYYFMAADDGNIDYYFIYGHTMKQVVQGYSYLTGTSPLPQRWALGYQQSRWSYETEEELQEIGSKLRELDIPCDALYLDIDHMERFKVFTWDKEKFKNPKKMIEKMHCQGFKIIPIVDPAIKVEVGYDMYDEGMSKHYFLKDQEGEVYYNRVWPGKCAYPDYSSKQTREWWAHKQNALLELGVDGIWTDMNEPSTFDGEMPLDIVFENDGRKTTHKEMHNLYGNQMAIATYSGLRTFNDKRPFVITRACFSGAQKYCLNWTGDNQSIWLHLQMAIPQMCNMGLSGIGYTGTDIGGYGFDCTKELLCRWIQLGCFSPLFRNHSSRPSRHQEPWHFDKETVDIYRKYVNLRYELIPYFYDLFYEMEQTGVPIIRPLVLEFEKDTQVAQINDQFMLGSTVLVAPIVEQGQTQRMIYLPKGNWIDYWTKELVKGGRHIIKKAQLDECPIFVKENSIIPKYKVQSYIGENKLDQLVLEVYGDKGGYIHYQDNGENFDYQQGGYNTYQYTIDEDGTLESVMIHQGYDEAYKEYIIKHNGKTITNK